MEKRVPTMKNKGRVRVGAADTGVCGRASGFARARPGEPLRVVTAAARP